MSRKVETSEDTPDLFHAEHSARLKAAYQDVRLARAGNNGVRRAQTKLQKTLHDVLREELGRRKDNP